MEFNVSLKDRELFGSALDNWGPEAQTFMLFEEMAELQKAVVKHYRGKGDKKAIAEEIADVQIMLSQIVVLHDIEGQVSDFIEQKLGRLEETLKPRLD